MSRSLLLAAPLLVVASAIAAPRPGTVGAPGKTAQDSCTACHAGLDDRRLQAPAQAASDDIHHRQGVSCAGCHGGDPTSGDAAVAMDPARGFVGRIESGQEPARCGSCHSDAAFMTRYGANIPTDQESQYRTSRHGQGLAKGDRNVATCSSCHGAHGVLPANDPRSAVYASRVVDTCGRCHGNVALMTGYGLKGDELAQYRQSVHYAALTTKNDLSAPTCNDCHGSHGAAPPGIESVSNVCGTCHLTQRERFDLSPHKDAFAAIEQPACEACHGNHAVIEPNDGWIGVAEGQVCGSCHSVGDAGAEAAGGLSSALAGASHAILATSRRVDAARRAGMLMEEAEVRLEEAQQALVLARNEIHTVTLARMSEQTQAVGRATAGADQLAAAAEAEIRFRRTGLFVSLGVILLAMLALALKIRALER